MIIEQPFYSEGSVFLVPLRNDGFARGVIARANPEMACIYGYFFGPKLFSADVAELGDIRRDSAIAQMIFGDLGLTNGEWSIVGSLPSWRRNEWTMPDFVRRDPIGKRAWRVRRSDDDPAMVESEEPVDFDTNLPDNSSWGYGAVELKLTKLLG